MSVPDAVADDRPLVDRIRQLLAGRWPIAAGTPIAEPPEISDVTEKRIIGGGHGFLVGGNLCVAATRRGLTVRVGPDDRAAALREPHVVAHRVGPRETSAFVVVEPAGLVDDEALANWISRGLRFVATL